MTRPTMRPGATRWMHPLAWWLWAAGLVGAAVQTTNPLLLVLLGLVVSYVAAARRAAIGTSRVYRFCCWSALGIVALCLLLQVGFADDGTSKAGLLAAFCFGARIGVVVLCIGAANALVSPQRLLGPAWRGLMVFPQLPAAFAQVRQARRLRAVGFGRAPRLLPTVFAEARARGRVAAFALEARGYGEEARLSHQWSFAEFAAVAAGTAAAVCFALTSTADRMPDPWTLQTPTVPALAALGVLCALLPAHLTPAPPAPRGAGALRTKAAG